MFTSLTAVQHERGPRNSTIRRQMALLLKDPNPPSDMRPPAPPIDLVLPKHSLLPQPIPLYNPYTFPSLSLINPPVLSIPPPPPSLMVNPILYGATSPAAICEVAAQLLFMNIRWAKSIPGFTNLSLQDAHLLLERSWKDVFVLAVAQFLFPLDFKILLDRHTPTVTEKDIDLFEAVLREVAKLHLDTNEYACLRALLLFSYGLDDQNLGLKRTDSRKLQETARIAMIYDQTACMLRDVSLKYFFKYFLCRISIRRISLLLNN